MIMYPLELTLATIAMPAMNANRGKVCFVCLWFLFIRLNMFVPIVIRSSQVEQDMPFCDQ
jgi:hypothetical protein